MSKPHQRKAKSTDIRRTPTDEQIEKALVKARGVVLLAARILDVDRVTIYRHVQKSARLREVLETCREVNLDIAEGKLLSAINSGQGWAICFYLKCQGKNRGYVERQKVEHGGDPENPTPIPHEVAVVDADEVRGRFARRITGIASRVGQGGADRGTKPGRNKGA